MRMVCLGDSLTFGYGVGRPRTWVARIARETNMDMHNHGINGDTTGGMLARFGTDVIDKKPDIVLIMGGANDIFMSGTDSVARSNICAMVHQAYAHHITPLVGIQIPISVEQGRKDWAALASYEHAYKVMEEYRDWLILFGQTFHVDIVDFYAAFQRALHQTEHDLYLDGLHPNERGHEVMFNCLYGRLKTLFQIGRNR